MPEHANSAVLARTTFRQHSHMPWDIFEEEHFFDQQIPGNLIETVCGMSSPFSDISGRCLCHCHAGPNRSGCICRCPLASSSSPPVAQPLTEKALLAAGKYLIRWHALTFYYDFIPEDQRKNIYGDIQTAAAIIRLELNRINVVDTWKQYNAEIARAAAPSPSSSTKSSSPGEHSKGSKQSFTRKLVGRFSPIPSSTSSATLESNETQGSSNQNQNDSRSASSSDNNRSSSSSSSTPLQTMFDTAAARLQVSRNQLELAFKYYASYLSSDRIKRITAKDVVRERRYRDLGEIILLDMEEFAMFSYSASSSQTQCPSLGPNNQNPHLRLHASTPSTASLSSREGEGDDEAENEVSPTPSVAIGTFCRANAIRRELLGKNHPSVTEAIAACTEHYFECLRYQEPRRVNRMYLWSLLTGRARDKKRKGKAMAVAGSGSKGADAVDALRRRHQKDWRIVWGIRPSVVPRFYVEDLSGSIKLEKRRAGADL
jgi:hypothetical protein